MELNINEKSYNGNCITALDLLSVDENSRVLDIGIGNGFIGRSLHGKVPIDGVTLSNVEKSQSSEYYEQVYLGDFLELDIIHKYDTIVLSHVLEHTVYPDLLIKKALVCLKKEGQIIISVPNVLFYKSRYQILKGNWFYENEGVWDNTHVKVFTEKYFQELSVLCDFQVLSKHHRFIFFKNLINTTQLRGVLKALVFFGSLFIYEFNWIIQNKELKR